MIKRIFHPIGQGAFYSERHENYNIVYDCGEWKDSKLADKVIKQSFNEEEEIDILFISHFDFDHVSKIVTLKNHVKTIKRVVLPLLNENEKIFISNIYRVLNLDILMLINSPQQFFGNDTKIIYVKAFESDNITNNNVIRNIDELQPNNGSIIIDSGTVLSQDNDNDWVFIPYNFKFPERSKELIEEFKRSKFDLKKLQYNPDYSLDEIIKDTKMTKKEGGKQIKRIYESIDGNINQNSMLLYSGPFKNNTTFLHSLKYVSNHFLGDKKVACVYTGDANLNIIPVRDILRDYWDNIGTIQIPHHGDKKVFNSSDFGDYRYFCPISFGTNNTYGHPSGKIISEILANSCFPIMVTEKLDSIFIEIINATLVKY